MASLAPTTWTEVQDIGTQSIQALAVNGDNVVAATSELALLYRSTDGGDSYSSVDLTGVYAGSTQDVAWLPAFNVFAAVASSEGFAYSATGAEGSWTANNPTGFPITHEFVRRVASDGSTIMILTQSGRVATTTTPGGTWTYNGTTIAAGVQPWLGLAALPGTTGTYAVGADGVIYYTEDSGATWTLATHPAIGQVTSIRALNNELVATTNGGDVLTSTDAKTWTIASSPGGSLNDISFDGSNYVIASDGPSPQMLVSSSTGGTWASYRVDALTSNFLSVSDQGTRFIAGGSAGILAVSNDSGLPEDIAPDDFDDTPYGIRGHEIPSSTQFKFLNRSSDITGVLNGFFEVMEAILPYFMDKGGLSECQHSLDMDGNKITNLADGVDDDDLATKQQLDALL